MELVIDIFYSAVLIASWYLMIRYRRNVKSWTGNFVWAERYLWSGGTYVILILWGLFLIFWGVLYPFWGLALIFGEAQTAPTKL